MDENTQNATTPEQLDTQPEVNGSTQSSTDTERKFTQEEVNRIVKERLQRERSKASTEQNDQSAARAANLDARESRLICKEFVLDNGYPRELLDAIDTSNPEEFQRKAFAVVNAVQARPVTGCPTPSFQAENPPCDIVSEAFSSHTKHKPRGAY